MTFLFTDLEGSTRLWEERPDEMRSALAAHDERVRAAIAAHGGYVDRFDTLYAQGLALDETEMVNLAFTKLDAITQTHERAEGDP